MYKLVLVHKLGDIEVNTMSLIKLSASTLLLGTLCVACATTTQNRTVGTSGFLDDYSQLKKGGEDQALMAYVDKSVNFSRYDAVFIDPVRIVRSDDSAMAEIPEEDLKVIADYFYASLNENLSKRYPRVKQPGPSTLRLRVALTDVSKSNVVMDTMSSFMPPMVAVSSITKLATGHTLAVGSATVEVEILDSVSGKRLAAAVDGQSGTKYSSGGGKFNKWADAKDACDFWAQRVARLLDDLSASSAE